MLLDSTIIMVLILPRLHYMDIHPQPILLHLDILMQDTLHLDTLHRDTLRQDTLHLDTHHNHTLIMVILLHIIQVTSVIFFVMDSVIYGSLLLSSV